MDMAAKILRHHRIRVLRLMRHANILGSIMNIHFKDDRIKAVIAIMVALYENELAVQPFLELPGSLLSALFPALKNEITKEKHGVLRLHPLVMLADDRLMHFLNSCKRSIAVSNDINMRKVII